ncbi:atp synthase gamma subunit : ATP synthase gamma chain OS=Singulisphaera acidiphila (strain ATCC BAA-1392 / DSM 18658 / VKM B-2454 / MOB10) GN=atpG PE=3 SV=1: ATP-synt [Gemmataceae bacterium]|jgi:F-type H+-transporting ATPase subunit gamma|nr:atp synthase gamma subunit : ATP synthase gamma chain OS=Singulisphaera acidiphila (strain ATCC BAA-1392 / DSM 18658 / VKM B-2454 / MOB10) GN=atpG PE=3 SV=1: ATP-synt [Gemmataceae bacterium]VTT97662.1 atp synthase gamma subunit : ATP synthase gamma chain OS=Singulisphaera acidiphila (strain ATCC BAA-1392 / DSM 18658 / VKM B-2454 / MOB10) GN=atpG PE=3 SV=1: ATP-synt [Gemmataceae bacterium]
MANLRILLKRRKAVRNIRKITRTMELIATARFKKALDRATEADAYTTKIAELAADLSKNAGDVSHPLLVTRPVKRSLLLVITANRGLCGGYNGSVIREGMHAVRQYREANTPFDLEVAGKRGIAFFKFQGVPRAAEYLNFNEKPTFAEVDVLANRYIDLFVSGQIDEVKVAYMKFINAARQQAVVETLLPLSSVSVETKAKAAAPGPKVEYEFLPDASGILEELVPAALKVRLFKMFLDAAVSEQIARRVAMKAATENAGDLIKEITRVYNRNRQANITKEISELIAGSEALK